MNSAISGWPNWSYEQSKDCDPVTLREVSKVLNYLTDNHPWNLRTFEAQFQVQVKRQRQIKVLWGIIAVLIFLTCTSVLLFIGKTLWFVAVILTVFASAYTLSKIRDLNSMQLEANLETLNFIKAKRFPIFFEDNHGTIFQITPNIWTTQNWFFLLSPEIKHFRGISLNGVPPAFKLLMLKSDLYKLKNVSSGKSSESTPNSRACPHLRAIQNKKALLSKFIRAVKFSTTTEPRKKWLSALVHIHNNWSTWCLYRDGALKDPIKTVFESAIIEALTGSTEHTAKDRLLLANFAKPDIRALNAWIKKLEIIPETEVQKHFKSSL